ncbi:DUF5947 family protein [Actinomadura livida]|uniref:DUF5947 family protein n=1 Tax=Actinomadura livida TaxID=79909 RepID=A0A7W7MX25_9ACTN|nr:MULTISPECIES: DUF5947 family protein [Actinomadura]MBB4773420.1 hypothetical protein [Actinomadura catellatispora]GGU08097.1 hypothetical protein GCM10010208_35580 [Actinomadura livida]
MRSGALDRAIRRASAAAGPAARGEADTCGLCDAPAPEPHAHVLDESKGELLCACRACGLLFEREGAGYGHYRLVPRRRERLRGVPAAELGVPVGLAFFTAGPDGAVTARYPSPMGATEWTVDPGTWADVTARAPRLAELRPGVEALLVNTVRGADEQWLVPIDDCYRLVAVIRRSWTGLSGGDRVWDDIDAFFTDLTETNSPGTKEH